MIKHALIIVIAAGTLALPGAAAAGVKLVHVTSPASPAI